MLREARKLMRVQRVLIERPLPEHDALGAEVDDREIALSADPVDRVRGVAAVVRVVEDHGPIEQPAVGGQVGVHVHEVLLVINTHDATGVPRGGQFERDSGRVEGTAHHPRGRDSIAVRANVAKAAAEPRLPGLDRGVGRGRVDEAIDLPVHVTHLKRGRALRGVDALNAADEPLPAALWLGGSLSAQFDRADREPRLSALVFDGAQRQPMLARLQIDRTEGLRRPGLHAGVVRHERLAQLLAIEQELHRAVVRRHVRRDGHVVRAIGGGLKLNLHLRAELVGLEEQNIVAVEVLRRSVFAA